MDRTPAAVGRDPAPKADGQNIGRSDRSQSQLTVEQENQAVKRQTLAVIVISRSMQRTEGRGQREDALRNTFWGDCRAHRESDPIRLPTGNARPTPQKSRG